MIAPETPTRGALRIGVVALLLLAAFFTALPWLGCGWNPVRGGLEPTFLGICTFGFASGPPVTAGYGLPGFAGPYWGNLIVGVVYLFAAVFAAVTKRPL
jgi:hypothetical protein